MSEASLAGRFAALPAERRQKILDGLSAHERRALEFTWEWWARPNQLPPPGDWRVWLILAGRGWGKTRTGAEWVRKRARARPSARIALVGATAADTRDVLIEGESGILAICPAHERPAYEPSKRRLTFPNGAIAVAYSAEEPDRLRGPQHTEAWADELAAWSAPEAWDQLQFGLRLGDSPRIVVTTTPRPTPLIRGLVKAPHVRVTRGATMDNQANLAPGFLEEIVAKYRDTRLGLQELQGLILEDLEGALFKREFIRYRAP